jgi:hypothetical protein
VSSDCLNDQFDVRWIVLIAFAMVPLVVEVVVGI